MNNNPEQRSEKLERAYNDMLDRVRDALEKAEKGDVPLSDAVHQARDASIKNNELSAEEADQVSRWVQRDLRDAGSYLADTGKDLRDWFHMDMELIEYSLLDLFGRAADQTKLALLQFQEELEHASELHSGEVTGPGTLECKSCGELLHFQETGHIPPCPRCHETIFVRKTT